METTAVNTALSTITVFPSSWKELRDYHEIVKSEILVSNKPLIIRAKLEWVKKVIEGILEDKELKEHFLKEFRLYEDEKIIAFEGVEMYQMEAGTKYNYKACGDPVWNDLDKQVSELTAKRKERETLLKAAKEGFVDQGTGVFVGPVPKSSTTVVACRIK